MLSTAQALVNEFANADDSSSAYFGAAWKNHSRYCKRLYDDICERLKTAEIAEYNQLLVLNKMISSIKVICSFTAVSGLSCPDLVKILDQQAHFLSLDPVAEER